MTTAATQVRPTIQFAEPVFAEERREPIENPRRFYLSHESGGYRAKVEVEWSWPEGKEPPREWLDRAEDIADEAFRAMIFAPEKISLALRGRTPRPHGNITEG